MNIRMLGYGMPLYVDKLEGRTVRRTGLLSGQVVWCERHDAQKA